MKKKKHKNLGDNCRYEVTTCPAIFGDMVFVSDLSDKNEYDSVSQDAVVSCSKYEEKE